MKKTLLFDMWGTLIENGVFPSPVRQVKRMLRIREPFPEYITKFEDIFMLNEYENLTESFKEVCRQFNLTPPPFVVDNCVGLWNKNAILAKPFPETLEVLEKLKKKYKLVLIANTDQFSANQVIKKFGLEKYFDNIILSYKFGKLKTSEGFFKDLEKELKTKKENMILIGDSLESDMLPAEKAEIKSILIDRRDKREYTPKIKSLEELEEKLEEL